MSRHPTDWTDWSLRGKKGDRNYFCAKESQIMYRVLSSVNGFNQKSETKKRLARNTFHGNTSAQGNRQQKLPQGFQERDRITCQEYFLWEMKTESVRIVYARTQSGVLSTRENHLSKEAVAKSAYSRTKYGQNTNEQLSRWLNSGKKHS